MSRLAIARKLVTNIFFLLQYQSTLVFPNNPIKVKVGNIIFKDPKAQGVDKTISLNIELV